MEFVRFERQLLDKITNSLERLVREAIGIVKHPQDAIHYEQITEKAINYEHQPYQGSKFCNVLCLQ